MKTIGIGLQTWNMFATGREEMFWKTYNSIVNEPYEHYTLDITTNCSTDSTDKVVRKLGGIVNNDVCQMWWGMEMAILAAAEHKPDIILFTADDIEYYPGWMEKLLAFWREAPDDLVLLTLFIEPEWDWNIPTGTIDAGGMRAITRASTPGACWSFRASDLDKVLPTGRRSPGEDLDVCERLRKAGYRMAQVDLADHIGEKQSAWGNQSWRTARPIDRAKWGI